MRQRHLLLALAPLSVRSSFKVPDFDVRLDEMSDNSQGIQQLGVKCWTKAVFTEVRFRDSEICGTKWYKVRVLSGYAKM